jgi:hypothetical protein
MSLWFPEGTEVEVKSLLATFLSVYPETTVWDGPSGWGWYIIGTQSPFDWPRFRARLDSLYSIPVLAADMVEYDSLVGTPGQVMALYKWSAEEVRREIGRARLITDDYPLTEFPMWRYIRGDWQLWHPATRGERP